MLLDEHVGKAVHQPLCLCLCQESMPPAISIILMLNMPLP